MARSKCPLMVAISKGVVRSPALIWLTLAPAATSILAASVYPPRVASNSAVAPPCAPINSL